MLQQLCEWSKKQASVQSGEDPDSEPEIHLQPLQFNSSVGIGNQLQDAPEITEVNFCFPTEETGEFILQIVSKTCK